MQFTTIILALAAAASTSAAARFSRLTRDGPPSFALKNFYFGGSPHSIMQWYSFDVDDGTKAAHCQTSSSIASGLKAFGQTPCNDTNWSFSFTFDNTTDPEPGYILTVTHEIAPGTNHTACRFFGQEQVQQVQNQLNPNGNYYALTAPDAFNLTSTNGPCLFS